MIYITGDVHGYIDFEKLNKLNDYDISYDDTLIILGDAGICWSKEQDKIVAKLYEKLKITVIFIDGNHENFDILNSCCIVNFKDAKMHKISDHIYHVLRGEIMHIEGFSFLCIGGACSKDKAFRKEGLSWWKDEEITKSDVENAIANLQSCDYFVDYVLTHCVDNKTLEKYTNEKKDKSSEMLNFIDEIVIYKAWFFGHYHINRPFGMNKYCLYESIVCLNNLSRNK